MDSWDNIGQNLDTHLGDGASDVRLAEGRRRFVEAVANANSTAEALPWFRRRLVPGASLAGVGVLAIIAIVVVLADRGRIRRLEPNRTSPLARSAVPPSSAASADNVQVVRLETSHDQSGATVQLMAGAMVTLSRRTHGESRQVGPKSYQVRLDYGEMTFTIDPRIGSTWTVETGLYQVRVVGTVFTVNRDPVRESVEVRVERGQVEIRRTAAARPPTGAGAETANASNQTVALAAGGVWRARGGLAVVRRGSSEETAAASPFAASPHLPVPPRPRGHRAGAAVARQGAAAAPGTWTAFYDAGDYAAAWRQARGEGHSRLISSLDVTRLSNLADAARLAGDSSGAQVTLTGLRRRFPGSRQAADAAFLLGRLAADVPGRLSDATTWFEAYLAERPRGVYAEEARGRLIVVHQRAGRASEARLAARAYLSRHPTGHYSDVARSVSP